MPESSPASSLSSANPDYAGLVRFLVQPFLEVPAALRVDCEVSPSRGKVLVRVAFEDSDKGRVYGRGGRNIQAIRTVLAAAAQLSGYSAHLDVFGASAGAGSEGQYESSAPRGDRPRRSVGPGGDRRQESRPVDSPSKPRPRPVPKVAPPVPPPDTSDFSPPDTDPAEPNSA
jgi:uncharacterized protein